MAPVSPAPPRGMAQFYGERKKKCCDGNHSVSLELFPGRAPSCQLGKDPNYFKNPTGGDGQVRQDAAYASIASESSQMTLRCCQFPIIPAPRATHAHSRLPSQLRPFVSVQNLDSRPAQEPPRLLNPLECFNVSVAHKMQHRREIRNKKHYGSIRWILQRSGPNRDG